MMKVTPTNKRFFVNATVDSVTNKIIVCAGTLPEQGGSVEYEVFRRPNCGAAGTREKASWAVAITTVLPSGSS